MYRNPYPGMTVPRYTCRLDNIEIPRLQGKIDFINSEDVGRQFVVSQVTTLAALCSDLTYEARQEITKEVVERI